MTVMITLECIIHLLKQYMGFELVILQFRLAMSGPSDIKAQKQTPVFTENGLKIVGVE